MAVLPIRIAGDPALHSPALPVENFDDELRTLVGDMFETMDAAPGVGLAAPQVGVGLRLFTYGWVDDDGTRWRGVAINPELWITPPPAGEADVDEGFGLRRAERAILRATDLEGNPFEIEAQGWLARILQHEFDHLDGTLYIDRLGERDQKLVHKISRKLGWGKPGVQWMPGVDDLEG